MKTFLLLLPFLFLSSCAKDKGSANSTKIETQFIERPNMSWGLPFEFKPIGSTAITTQKIGEAVAMIRYVEGGFATGFFISEDGLFLTNEHVISRDWCSKKRCAGIQIIREFRPGGALEVFDEFEILAESKEADISLLRVKIPDGKKVPYLKLSQRDEFADEDSLLIVGHPGGASLHVSSSKLNNPDPQEAEFLSISVGGNSGSPIIDSKTMEVVAIHSGSSRRDQKIDRKGIVYGYGKGTMASSIEKTLKALDQEFTRKKPQFVYGKKEKPSKKEFLIATPEDLSANEIDEALFIRGFIGTESENAALQKLIANTSSKVFNTETIADLFFRLISTDLNRGKKLSISLEDFKPLIQEGIELPSSVKIFYLNQSQQECFNKVKESTLNSASKRFLQIGSNCLTKNIDEKTDALAYLSEVFEINKDDIWAEEHEYFNSRLMSGISYQLLLRETISADESNAIKSTLKKIGTEAPTIRQYFKAEGMLTMFIEKQKMLGPGSFKGL